MATLDAPKLLVLTNQTKLTLTVTLIVTDTVPYILAYKLTIFGSISTFKLWGSAYTHVMPHSQSRQSA